MLLGDPRHATILLEKLNLRLILASQFIQRFDIELIHKPGKKNIIADALSRLPSQNSEPNAEDLDTLELVGAFNGEVGATVDIGNPDMPAVDPSPVYTMTMTELSPDFRKKLLNGYEADNRLNKIIDLLEIENKPKDRSRGRQDPYDTFNVYWLEEENIACWDQHINHRLTAQESFGLWCSCQYRIIQNQSRRRK